MPNPRDIFLQQFKPALDDKADHYQPFRAVLTSSAGATDTGDVWKDENARLVWFRAWGGAAPAWALCDVLEPVLGLGVYIKFNQDINQYEVLRDDPLMRSPDSDRTSYRAITNQDLLKGGRFQLWLDPTMFIPLSIYPTAADTVNVVSGDYILGGERLTFAGAVDQDISASRPAVGFHRFVGFYLDDTTTLSTIDGATVATGTDAIEPAWPSGVLRVGVVDIDNATDISIDNIDNRKVIYTEDDETGALNVWPRADEVNINFTPYAAWALAVDALAAGEQAIIGEGTFLSDDERIAVAAYVKGSGIDVALLSTTTKDRVLELAIAPIILEDFTISNIYTATLYGDYYGAYIDENASIDAFRVKFVVTGTGGNINYGCYIASAGTHRFADCIWDVRNGTANYALYMDAQGLYSGSVVNLFTPDITGDVHNEDGTLNIYGGVIDGDVYAGDGATITLGNLPLITGSVTSHAGGSVVGSYIDSNGVIYPPIDQFIPLDIYDPAPSRGAESNIHGGLLALATGQPLDSVPTDLVVSQGIGKLVIVLNAGADFTGDITVTGTSVNRNTGALTPADTDTITTDALTTDGSDVDGNGNTRHAFTGAYITSKWFTGTVTLSTANLTLTDVDVYHVSFEQFSDQSSITVTTFDVNLIATNVNAEFDAYLYTLEVAGDKCDITRIGSLNLGTDGVTAIANRYYRLRRGNLGIALDGSTDGIWVDIYYSNSPAYIEDVTMKVWATKSVSVGG